MALKRKARHRLSVKESGINVSMNPFTCSGTGGSSQARLKKMRPCTLVNFLSQQYFLCDEAFVLVVNTPPVGLRVRKQTVIMPLR